MNEKFDKKYYEDIWDTVHRHDYCESLANSLIQKYGKIRFLDIGTGCGYLVQLLNEKGAIAYGLEISQYALDNSHGNVLPGSVTDIPLQDASFDVIHSQGMWEYVAEEDIDKAWKECNRVGKIQVHNIDPIGSGLGEEGFVTRQTHEWWDKKLKLKLNLGSGNLYYEDYVNVDLYAEKVDLRHDLTLPLPYSDSSVDEIYASHIVEHFSRKEWEKVKRDWVRVLKPGAKLTIGCPEFEKCLLKWQTDKTTDYWLQTIYGSQEDEGNFHKNGFTKDGLIKELTDLGFRDFNIVEDEPQNLEVECTKF